MPTQHDLDQLVDNYVNHIIDGMDTDSLIHLVYDMLVREYEKLSWDDITEEIVDLYDEDTLIGLIGDSGDNNTDEPSEATGWWQLK